MAGIALHDLDQIGDEIAAPAQLHIDAAPALAHEIAAADQAVEDENDENYDQGRDGGDYPYGLHCLSLAPDGAHACPRSGPGYLVLVAAAADQVQWLRLRRVSPE